MIRWALAPAAVLALGGCSVLSGGEDSDLRAGLKASLASEPAVCTDYRATYVAGFEAHVAGISSNSESLKQIGLEHLERSRSILAANDLNRADCTRPHCIIEPRDAGRLESWCGYRVDRSEGPEVFQWFEWSRVETDR